MTEDEDGAATGEGGPPSPAQAASGLESRQGGKAASGEPSPGEVSSDVDPPAIDLDTVRDRAS
jgi:hypothetical protein